MSLYIYIYVYAWASAARPPRPWWGRATPPAEAAPGPHMII